MPAEFDEIRPYSPEELPQVYEELIQDPAFKEVVKVIMPNIPFEMLVAKLRQCKTNLEFQKSFCYNLLVDIVKKHSDGISMDCSSIVDRDNNYTFISNHRDIVLDSAFLSILLIDNGFRTTVEIAIGDNLLIYPWIKKLVRINKSFIVKRGVSIRQKLETSSLMSKYMHFAITQKKENIWIAQRQGRSKDSTDNTQESVLKMMSMAGEGNAIDRLRDMNIVPLTISYEYDPCDYLKATEMQKKRDNPSFEKSKEDDLINMKIGIFGYKGRIHYQTSKCINEFLDSIDRSLSKVEIFEAITKKIDKCIHSNYRLYSCNYVACDLLMEDEKFKNQYSEEEKERFINYINGQLQKIDLANKDITFLRHKLLLMYANPLLNYLEAAK